MPLADGDPAPPGDVWLRVVKDPRWIKADGTLSNSAFSGAVVFRDPPERPWALELSGALLSLVPDLDAYGKFRSGDDYGGHMFHSVGGLYKPEYATDVVYTPILPEVNPNKPDNAHTDLVSYELTMEHKYLLRDWLQEVVTAVRPNELHKLDALR